MSWGQHRTGWAVIWHLFQHVSSLVGRKATRAVPFNPSSLLPAPALEVKQPLCGAVVAMHTHFQQKVNGILKWPWMNPIILDLRPQYKYLESVLQLHHTAVEEGRGELRGDTDNFSYSPTGLSWNRVSCLTQDVICVHYPLWLRSKGLLLTQVEFGCYCARWVIEYFYRDTHCLTCLYLGGKKTELMLYLRPFREIYWYIFLEKPFYLALLPFFLR